MKTYIRFMLSSLGAQKYGVELNHGDESDVGKQTQDGTVQKDKLVGSLVLGKPLFCRGFCLKFNPLNPVGNFALREGISHFRTYECANLHYLKNN